MVAIHSSSTNPERVLRHLLWRQGFRYLVNDKRLPGKPDIVLPKYRTVIFVNGCFWHGHKGCTKYTIPKTNTEFWVAKIARNQERDQEVWRKIEAKGWYVIIVWECEIEKAKLKKTLERVTSELWHNLDSLNLIKNERKINRIAYLNERKRKRALSDAVMTELRQEE